MQLRIFDVVRSRGGAADRRGIADEVYAMDPNGGPGDPEGCVGVQICHANKRLAPFGYRIVGRAGRGGTYRINTTLKG